MQRLHGIMSDPREDYVAAPPDAGGHLGSQSPPQDALQVQRPDRRAEHPALHHDAPQRRESPRAALMVFLLVAFVVLGFIVVGAYWPF